MSAVLKLPPINANRYFKSSKWVDLFTCNKIREEFEGVNLSECVGYADPYFEFQKYTLNKRDLMPPTIRAVIDQLQSEQTLTFLEHMTGLNDLIPDPGLWGGGLHITLPGGYLAMHRDFTVLPTSFRKNMQMRRVLNLIGYFSECELVIDKVKTKNLINDWVVFDPTSCFHGHPNRYQGNLPRYSIAVYYYQEMEVPRSEWRSTEYQKLSWKDDSTEYEQKRRQRADVNFRYKNFLPEGNI